MKTIIYMIAALLLASAVVAVLYKATAAADSKVSAASVSHRPELEYLKAVNSVAPPEDPQLLFLLMAEYSNANRQGEGAEFFSARLKEVEPRLTDVQKALYLSAIGLLRAQNASSVPLLHRIGYVKDTIAMLEQAERKLPAGLEVRPSLKRNFLASGTMPTTCAASSRTSPSSAAPSSKSVARASS